MHCVDKLTIECESTLPMPDRFVFHVNGSAELLALYHDGILDMIYHDATNFESRKIQKWLRELLRDTILRIAICRSVLLHLPYPIQNFSVFMTAVTYLKCIESGPERLLSKSFSRQE